MQHFDLAGFELACGHALPAGATLAYKVHGPPVGASKGVILHPTSFDAVHDELEYSIGEGQTLDTSAYTVVVPNLLGNGVSYSPSRMGHAERLAGYPPLLSIGDNAAPAARAPARGARRADGPAEPRVRLLDGRAAGVRVGAVA